MTRPYLKRCGEWETVNLEAKSHGEIVVEVGSGGTPSTKEDSFWSGSIPWLTPKEITTGSTYRYLLSTERTLAKEGLVKAGKLWEEDTVMLTKRAPVGEAVINKIPMAVNQGFLCFRCGRKLYPEYLYYWFKANRPYLDAVANGSTYPELYPSDLFEFEVSLPSLAEQQAIAHILGTLDDKIELNRRMNETLEAMARAIFKSWFVDFDPVRAKAEGRKPAGMNAETANLFPNSFIDSELGKIPKGWRLATFDELIDFVIGGDWGKENPEGEFFQPAYCIRGADIPQLQNSALSSKMPIRYIKESSLRKRGLLQDDIVFEISGGSPTQQTGRTVLVSTELLQRLNYSLICSNFCRLVRTKKHIPSCFIYFWLRWLYSIDAFWQYETGTTGIKNFAFKVFSKEHPLCLPPAELLSSFSDTVKPLLKKRDSNGLESETLASIRDALLPKLLSGGIRVKDAEKFVEEA